MNYYFKFHILFRFVGYFVCKDTVFFDIVAMQKNTRVIAPQPLGLQRLTYPPDTPFTTRLATALLLA